MRSLRHPLALWVLRAVLAAWLGVLGATEYHRAAVVHATCEHGQVVETHGEVRAEAPSDGPIAKIAPADAPHEHGCFLPAGAATAEGGIAGVTAPSCSAAPPRPVASQIVVAPRPPPIDYAPKTSPPAFG